MNRAWTWNSNSVLFEYTWKASVLPWSFSTVSVILHCYRYYYAIIYTETPHNSGMVKKHIGVPGKTRYTQKKSVKENVRQYCAIQP